MTGKAVRAEIIQRDGTVDLALLRVRLAGPAPSVAVFRDSPGRMGGGEISVIGYPLHGRVTIKPIFTKGRAIDAWLGGAAGFASRPISGAAIAAVRCLTSMGW